MVGAGRTFVALTAGIVCALGAGQPAGAYTAAGDRTFPATLILPQLSPGDEIYFNYNMLPLSSNGAGTANRATNFTVTYGKTITDNLGVYIEETYTGIGQEGLGTQWGWQNLDGALKYVAVSSIEHEFIMTLGLDRETGGTGATRVGASPSGATSPQLYMGKGLGDLDIGYLRPLAVTTFNSVGFADTAPRPDILSNGFSVQYSIPYLEAKVQNLDLPDAVRRMTPITEVLFTSPVGRSYGARTTALIAPGISYAGEGWEFAVEAQIPATRATGSGIGVTAQLHLALDFLFADTPLGRPLFSSYP
jgi:hypothetical protein